MPSLTVAQVKNIVRNMIKVRGITMNGLISPIPKSPPDLPISFSLTPVWKSGNFFDAAHPTRIKVPNNRAGRYLIHAELQWSPKIGSKTFTDIQSTGGFFGAYLVRNNTTGMNLQKEAQSTAAVIAGSTLVTHNVILETQLAAGHFVELYVFQRVTGVDPGNDFAIEVNATMTVRRLGRST